ncbi:hypothetical protein HDV00_005004 [Rhizophlyctis rosea]|nr:hypothetical protein HDV00_005004 [Rhizophlyctis rosea]
MKFSSYVSSITLHPSTSTVTIANSKVFGKKSITVPVENVTLTQRALTGKGQTKTQLPEPKNLPQWKKALWEWRASTIPLEVVEEGKRRVYSVARLGTWMDPKMVDGLLGRV